MSEDLMNPGLYNLYMPREEFAEEVMRFRKEFRSVGENIYGSAGLLRYEEYVPWLESTRQLANYLEHEVPAVSYFLVRETDQRILGCCQLRHGLNDELRTRGGNIGYSIRPSERGNGYGYLQLRLILREAMYFTMPKVLLICDKNNLASAAVIQKCGGLLEKEAYCEKDAVTLQYYWITI